MTTLKYIINERCEQAHMRGTARGVSQDEAQPVDGIYEVSTILIGFDNHTNRRETVAFKISGIGPGQITEPYKLKSLQFRAAYL